MRMTLFVMSLSLGCSSGEEKRCPKQSDVGTNDVVYRPGAALPTELVDVLGKLTVCGFHDETVVIENVRAVHGDVEVFGNTGVGSLIFDDIRTVSGTLSIGDDAAERIQWPTLETAADILLQWRGVSGVDFASLVSAENIRSIESDVAVDVALPSLENVTSLRFVHTQASLDLPKLEAADVIFVLGAGDHIVSLPAVSAVRKTLVISDVRGDDVLDLSALESVGEHLELSDLNYSQVTMNNLSRVGRFLVASNASLTSIEAASLDSADEVRVVENPLLPTCEIESMIEQLEATPTGGVEISGNLPCD